MTTGKWTSLLALLACLVVAGCSTGSYQPMPEDQTGAVHGGSDGGGGGGGSSM